MCACSQIFVLAIKVIGYPQVCALNAKFRRAKFLLQPDTNLSGANAHLRYLGLNITQLLLNKKLVFVGKFGHLLLSKSEKLNTWNHLI